MAVAQAYGKTVTSGSVFAYDVADFRNSYIGKPGYNVTGTPAAWVGNNNTSDFKTTIGTTTVNIPAIGTREVQYVDIWNTGASNCCPSLWRYGNWGITTGVVGNTLYTYSIIYKCKSGYTHPNFMYRYEYNGGTYVLETGIFDTAKRIDLGDGWYQAYNTFTTNASTNLLYLGMWYYQYNVYDTVYLYKASLTQGNHVSSPEQIIPPSTTRSATQGLLPLVGNSTLDLTNVSFDSNAQMVFDGTDDRIQTSYAPTFGDFTVCLIFKDNGSGAWGRIVDKLYTTGFFISSYFASSGANYVGAGIIEPNYPHGIALPYEAGKYHYFASVRNGTTHTIYLDGITQTTSKTVSSNLLDSTSIAFGDWSGGTTQPYKGELPVVSIYNRALSAAEVGQNYRHYKTRFNLS